MRKILIPLLFLTSCQSYTPQGTYPASSMQAQTCSPGAVESCQIANGSGQQTCESSGENWGSCVASSCNSGYDLQNDSCVVVSGPGTSPVSNIAIQSPQNYQVIQREASGQATVHVNATTLGSGPTVRIFAADAAGNIVADSNHPNSAALSVDVRLPVGGWYKLSIQELAADNTTVVAEGNVKNVGVGEVFLTAGQSNSVASGQTPQANSNMVSSASLSGNSLAWGSTIDTGTTGTPWPVFANLLAAQLKLPIGIIQVGCGGTDTSQWLPASAGATAATFCGADTQSPGGLYVRLVNATKALGSYRALLWHQGESDTILKTPHQVYHDRMALIMSQLNTDTQKSVNWVVANVSYVPGTEITTATCAMAYKPYQYASTMIEVRLAQQMLWGEHKAFVGPDTDGLISTYRYPGNIGGCIHFSDAGLKLHGQLWYRTVSETGLVPGAEAAPARSLTPMYQSYLPNPLDFYYTPSATPPTGYVEVGQAFSVGTSSALTGPLMMCRFSSGAHFLSTSANCEGFTVESTLGYIATAASTIQTHPLYRFSSPNSPISFFSSTSIDAGLTTGYVLQGIQGYAY